MSGRINQDELCCWGLFLDCCASYYNGLDGENESEVKCTYTAASHDDDDNSLLSRCSYEYQRTILADSNYQY